MTLTEKFRKIIIQNELGGDLTEALKFSDPDGVRSGKSGWSFGVCQFDLSNNSMAATCLRECGFSENEIAALKEQTLDVTLLQPKLRAAAEVVSRYDEQQLSSCLTRAQNVCSLFHVAAADDAAILAVADYDNQYHFSAIDKKGFLVHELVTLGRPFTAQDILDYKLQHTKYGREYPEDCRRRYGNVVKIAL
jgi:hypothetical protein